MITQTMNGKAVKLGPNKMQGIGTGVIPKNLDLSVVDKVEQLTNEESITMALRLAYEEEIFCWDLLWRCRNSSQSPCRTRCLCGKTMLWVYRPR